MCAEEMWTIVLKEEYSGGAGADSSASTTMGKNLQQKPPEERQVWQDAGKVLGSFAGVASIAALVIGSIHRSKIFTTFMDSFLTIMSALADLLLVPLVPILAPALMWIWKTLGPIVSDFSKQMMEWIKDPWAAIRDIFSGVGNAIKTITTMFGGGENSALAVIGSNAATILKKAGDEISEHGKNMWDILTNKAIPWSDKLTLIWEELQKMWTNFSKDPQVQEAWRNIWSTIGDWFYTNIILPLKEQWDYLVGDYLPKLLSWVFIDWLPKTIEGMIYNSLPDWAKKVGTFIGGYTGPGQVPNAPSYTPPAWSGIGSGVLQEKQKMDINIKIMKDNSISGVEVYNNGEISSEWMKNAQWSTV